MAKRSVWGQILYNVVENRVNLYVWSKIKKPKSTKERNWNTDDSKKKLKTKNI